MTSIDVGVSSGFKINYHGPRLPVETKNLKSVLENPHIALEKVENEIQLGRIYCTEVNFSSIKSLTLPKVG
jgi:hypothetical protein